MSSYQTSSEGYRINRAWHESAQNVLAMMKFPTNRIAQEALQTFTSVLKIENRRHGPSSKACRHIQISVIPFRQNDCRIKEERKNAENLPQQFSSNRKQKERERQSLELQVTLQSNNIFIKAPPNYMFVVERNFTFLEWDNSEERFPRLLWLLTVISARLLSRWQR